MSEPGRTTDRDELARRFEKYARHSALGVIPIAVLAAVDLWTGWLTGEWRVDVALLAASGMAPWSAFSFRMLARRFRAGELAHKPAPARWVGYIVSLFGVLGVSAGIGYLVGGWIVGLLLPSLTVVLIAASAAVGIRRRPKPDTANEGTGA